MLGWSLLETRIAEYSLKLLVPNKKLASRNRVGSWDFSRGQSHHWKIILIKNSVALNWVAYISLQSNPLLLLTPVSCTLGPKPTMQCCPWNVPTAVEFVSWRNLTQSVKPPGTSKFPRRILDSNFAHVSKTLKENIREESFESKSAHQTLPNLVAHSKLRQNIATGDHTERHWTACTEHKLWSKILKVKHSTAWP